MSALELADKLDSRRNLLMDKEHEFGSRAILLYGYSAYMIRQQQSEIEVLKQQYELYGAVWHDEHGYQFTATVGEKVLNNDRWIKLYRKVEK